MAENELLETEPKNEESSDQGEKIFTQKRACEITGLSVDEIRKWESYFNLQVPRTKGGQRRYTLENLEQFKTIKTKIEDTGWGINDAIQWWNGDDTENLLRNLKVPSELEKQIIELKEIIKMQREEMDIDRENMKLMPELIRKAVTEAIQTQNQIASSSTIQRIPAPEEPEETTKEVKKLNFVQKFGAKLLGLETEKRG